MDTVETKNSLVNFIILLFYDKRPGACAPGLICRVINSLTSEGFQEPAPGRKLLPYAREKQ